MDGHNSEINKKIRNLYLPKIQSNQIKRNSEIIYSPLVSQIINIKIYL